MIFFSLSCLAMIFAALMLFTKTFLQNNNRIMNIRSVQEMAEKSQAFRRRRIAIVTLETRALQVVGYHNMSCEEYAARHGYDYRFLSKYENDTELPVYWKKLQVVADTMEEPFDYVLWLDSDTLIVHPEIPLEAVVDMNPSASIYIGKDRDGFNAGAFLVCNNGIGRQFLANCFETYFSREQCRSPDGKYQTNGKWAGPCYEQGVMSDLLRTSYKTHTFVVPQYVFYHSDDEYFGAFVVHRFGDKDLASDSFRRYILGKNKL